ncbi:AI-2E family transporter [Methylobacterium crusticola]|uniref:AI-2E family transporter n=1 Tax=Methylobacterium crusticola TaxID=1697972 RepID=UPI001939CE9B|nr:AI-2E family transporter [Methylobacterium crusticola]
MQRRAAIVLAVLAVVVVLLYQLRDVLVPFVAGAALAYVLDPVADRLERLGIGRLAATFVILAVFLLLLVVALIVVVPLAANQVAALVASMPAMITRIQAIIADHAGPLLERAGGSGALQELQSSVGNLMGQGATWLLGFLRSLWSGSQAIVGIVSLLVVTPVVAFYLLVDWDRMIATLDRWVPPRHRDTARLLARDIDGAITSFIRGQSLVCLILGTFYAAGLWLVGLNFGVLIGLMAGFLTFIPYVGSLTGFLLSTGVALVQFWPDWVSIVMTLAIFLVGQFIEGNVLQPKLVGDAVRLHPVWLMFALLAFGSLFGFLGLLLAVPIAAALGVVARYGVRRYLQSRLYHDGTPILAADGLPPVAELTPPALSKP